MKNKLVVMMGICCALSVLCACGKKEASNVVESTSTEVSISEEKQEVSAETDTVEAEAASDLGYIYKVPLEDVYINAPDAYHYMEYGTCQMFEKVPDSTAYISIVYDTLSTPADMDDVFSQCYLSFQAQVNNHGTDTITDVDPESLNVTKTGGNVSGIDVDIYEGTLNCGMEGNERTSFFYGYSFILYSESAGHDEPYSIFGVCKDGSDEDGVAEIKHYVDEMMESVRDTK